MPAAYLKAAEGLEGEAAAVGIHGAELWALAVAATIAVLLLLVLFVLLCIARRWVCFNTTFKDNIKIMHKS